jgi:hypothetical protein
MSDPGLSTTSVILPCEPDQFRNFISGLLGRPQTINRNSRGAHELTRADIENLYHLLDQRITSQNEGTLIQFTARIRYDDNSSVLLNSFEDFQVYNEVRPLISTGVALSWTFLIKFRNKKFPERQQIDIDVGVSDRYGFVPFERLGVSGYFHVQINHTDRSWGTDIDALLKGHLEMLLKAEGKFRTLANKYSTWLGWLWGILVGVLALFAASRATDDLVGRYIAEAKKAAAASDVAAKIDFLTNVVASGLWARYSLYVAGFIIVALIISILSGALVANYAGTERPSFIILTKKAEEYRQIRLKQFENDWESWPHESGQDDKWSFCLTAGTLCRANQERP